ncbi:MAG: hypothetical protein ACI8TX_001446 [Hyphomicrobiaceae bacterium]
MEAVAKMTWTRVIAYWAGAFVLALMLRASIQETASYDEAPVERTPLVEAVPERVDHFRLNARGVDLVFERGADARWSASQELGESVPSDIIEAVVETLAGLPVIEAVGESKAQGDQFGLENPAVRLRLQIAGKPVANLALGHLNPTGTAVYVRRAGESRVFLLGLNARYYMDLILDTVERESGNRPDSVDTKPGPAN